MAKVFILGGEFGGVVAAANLAAEIARHDPTAHYDHDLMMVLDVAGGDSIYSTRIYGQAIPRVSATAASGAGPRVYMKSIGKAITPNSRISIFKQCFVRVHSWSALLPSHQTTKPHEPGIMKRHEPEVRRERY